MSSSQPGTVEIDEEVQEPIKTVKKTNSLSVKGVFINHTKKCSLVISKTDGNSEENKQGAC